MKERKKEGKEWDGWDGIGWVGGWSGEGIYKYCRLNGFINRLNGQMMDGWLDVVG